MGFLDRFFSKPPSQDKFARMVMEGVRQAGEKGPVIYDREQFRLFTPSEKGTRLFLSNAYQEYCAAAKSDRARLLRTFCRTWFVSNKEMPEEYEDAKPDLLPVLRSRSYYENARSQLRLDGNPNGDWPQQIVGEHLAVSLVYDLPEAMRSVAQDDLDRWGVTFYEAMEAARESLLRMPHNFVGPKEGEGVYLSATGDNYDASRLLLLDTIRQFRIKGATIAMIPNRDTLIVAGSDDVKALEGMVALAKDALQKPRPLSGLALRLDGDAWVPWIPEPTHLLHGEFRLLQVQAFGQDYADQKAWLDRLHEKTGEDVFVASYSGIRDESSDAIITYCVWGKDVVTLLPLTDRVAFVEQDREPIMVDWDRAVETVGSMMEPLDMYPPRYRVSGFPSEEQLSAMAEPRK